MTSDIELHPDFTPTPTTLFPGLNPAEIVAQATAIADVIAPLILDRKLYKEIGNSKHVYIDAWTLAGTLLGVFATTVRTWEIGRDDGFGACVEARTMGGAVVGRAEAVVTRAEAKWAEKEPFQLISMAQTRASSKALRMPLGFVMKLAGYDTTPAEEMEAAAARGETVTGGKGVRTGWKDIGEQQRWHADLGVFIEQHDLRQWVAEFIASKGYGPRPLPKAQFMDLKRAIVREVDARAKTSDPGKASAPPRPAGSDPTSEAAVDDRRNTGRLKVGEGSARQATTDSASDPTSPGSAARGVGRIADSGDTDASVTGQDPPGSPNAEAPTPRPSPTSPGRGRGRRSRPEVPGSASAGDVGEGPPAGPTTADDDAEQAAFDEAHADPGRWTR